MSFLPRYLLPASPDLADIIHAERLSRLWKGTTASTFHSKYLFKRPGVQARFLFPRRLLTDDLKNCFPETDKGMQYLSLPPSLLPGGWMGAVTLGATGCFRQRHLPQLLPTFLCPCGAAGCHPGGQGHLEVAPVGCILAGNPCERPSRAR